MQFSYLFGVLLHDLFSKSGLLPSEESAASHAPNWSIWTNFSVSKIHPVLKSGEQEGGGGAGRWEGSRAWEGQALGLDSSRKGGRQSSTKLVQLTLRAESGDSSSRTAWVGLHSGCQTASTCSNLLLNPLTCVCLLRVMLMVHWNGKIFRNAKIWVWSKRKKQLEA